ncbi:MAG: hypothetical protein M3380_03075, partial [Chloroflexota bacterium]|nr:hypothetical protein [Chloroflexota bacterium]
VYTVYTFNTYRWYRVVCVVVRVSTRPAADMCSRCVLIAKAQATHVLRDQARHNPVALPYQERHDLVFGLPFARSLQATAPSVVYIVHHHAGTRCQHCTSEADVEAVGRDATTLIDELFGALRVPALKIRRFTCTGSTVEVQGRRRL